MPPSLVYADISVKLCKCNTINIADDGIPQSSPNPWSQWVWKTYTPQTKGFTDARSIEDFSYNDSIPSVTSPQWRVLLCWHGWLTCGLIWYFVRSLPTYTKRPRGDSRIFENYVRTIALVGWQLPPPIHSTPSSSFVGEIAGTPAVRSSLSTLPTRIPRQRLILRLEELANQVRIAASTGCGSPNKKSPGPAYSIFGEQRASTFLLVKTVGTELECLKQTCFVFLTADILFIIYGLWNKITILYAYYFLSTA